MHVAHGSEHGSQPLHTSVRAINGSRKFTCREKKSIVVLLPKGWSTNVQEETATY